MTDSVRVACAQVTSTPDMAANIEAAVSGVRAAAADGALLVTLPENAALLGPGGAMREAALDPGPHAARRAFADVARACGVWLLGGSIAEKTQGPRLANRSLLFDDRGRMVAEYDKIHMFDVTLDGGEIYRESESYRPGDTARLASTPWGGLGMTICYDLRCPALYRGLAQAGAAMLAVPSAFTVPTGQAHWHVLLRARAIETGCFVIAPAQCGTH
jgi:predicted amidohydrolase